MHQDLHVVLRPVRLGEDRRLAVTFTAELYDAANDKTHRVEKTYALADNVFLHIQTEVDNLLRQACGEIVRVSSKGRVI